MNTEIDKMIQKHLDVLRCVRYRDGGKEKVFQSFLES